MRTEQNNDIAAIRPGYVNLAPIQPLQKLGKDDRAYEASSFAQMVREWHLDIVNRNIDERREIAEVGRMMANLRSGKLIMQRDPVHGALTFVKPLPHKPRRDRHIYPLAQVNSSQLTSVWTLSRPKAVPRHFGDTTKAQIQAAMIEKIIAHYDVELFDEYFHQAESLSMMDYGTTGIRVFYDKALNTIRQLQPVIQNADKTIHEGYGFCQECGSEGSEEDFRSAIDMPPRCSKCNSYNVSDLVPKQVVEASEVVGVQTVEQGDIGAELLKIPACNWDMRVLMHESSYFAYRTEVPRRFVESVLGVEVSADDPNDDYGLRVINELGTRGGSIEGLGRDNVFGNVTIEDTAVMDEEWYEPEWYHGVKLSKDEKTISGETIPAGTPLEQVFPDGICVMGFNDMGVLVAAYNEKRRIVGSIYHIQSFSGVGKGTQDAVEVSEQLNIAHSAAMEQIKRIGAGGGWAYDKDRISATEAKALLKPGKLVPVDSKSGAVPLDSILKRIEVGELNQSNLAVIAQLSNMLNISFQTTDFTSGVADNRVDVDTARGQELLMSQNQQRSAAPLRMKGWSRARVFEHVIDLFRENIKVAKYFGTTDKFALTKGRLIAGDELPEKVRCDFVPDSEQPTNTYTKQQNMADMLEKSQHFGVPFMELAKTDPRIAAWFASGFQIELPNYNYTEMLLVCQDRLDNLKELVTEAEQIAELAGVSAPAEQAAEMIVDSLTRKVVAGEENLAVKAQIIGEYLDDDEVTEWSPLMSASVQALIKRHYVLDRDFRVGLQQLEQEGQIALQMQAQQAQMAAQMQMQQAQMALAAPQMQAQQEQEVIGNGLNRAANLVEEEERFAREQEGKDLDHQRNIELEKVRASSRNRKQK